MKTEIEKSIKQYVELYDAIQEKTGSNEIAIVILQEIGKDRRGREIAENKDNVLATEKQKNCLRDLGIEFPESITKREASDLIAEKLDKD